VVVYHRKEVMIMRKIKVKANISGWFEGGSLKLGYDLGDMDISLTVERIEVEPIHTNEEEYEYYRSIRLLTTDGQVLELSCCAGEAESLEIRNVEEFSGREPQVVKEEPPDLWLAPKSKRNKR
jgi:hypothetical protein